MRLNTLSAGVLLGMPLAGATDEAADRLFGTHSDLPPQPVAGPAPDVPGVMTTNPTLLGLTYEDIARASGSWTTPGGPADAFNTINSWDPVNLSMNVPQRIEAIKASQRNPDPFMSSLREAAMAQLRNKQTGRKNTFVVGPRGIEGPLGNTILGGGTSMLGS